MLENVDVDPHTRQVDYQSQRLTENTRASYPIEYMDNAPIPCVGPHPKNVSELRLGHCPLCTFCCHLSPDVPQKGMRRTNMIPQRQPGPGLHPLPW